MFDVGLPAYVIGTINVNNDPLLCIKSVKLINLILKQSSE